MGILRQHEIKHYGGKLSELPAKLPYGDTFISSDTGQFFKYNQDNLPQEVTTGSVSELELEIKTNIQGYYGLLSGVYFGGTATSIDIATEQTNQWLDVQMDVDAQGLFDNRVKDMKDAQAVGNTGDGSDGSPLVFLLEGLTTQSTANVRVSMTFNPDEDGGKLDTRLLFERHSGTTPSEDFSIEATAMAMEAGAEEDYANSPNIQFFIGDTIDTNAAGDAGKVRFQFKSDVAGTITMNEIALFIQL